MIRPDGSFILDTMQKQGSLASIHNGVFMLAKKYLQDHAFEESAQEIVDKYYTEEDLTPSYADFCEKAKIEVWGDVMEAGRGGIYYRIVREPHLLEKFHIRGEGVSLFASKHPYPKYGGTERNG